MLLHGFDTIMLAAESSPPGRGGGQGSVLTHIIIPLLLLFGAMYFIMVLPQKRRDRQRREMLDQLRKGNDVVTIGGIHGTVINASNEKVELDTGGGQTMTFSRAAIARVVSEDDKKG
jgi:preprotein translocase subunit YajC